MVVQPAVGAAPVAPPDVEEDGGAGVGSDFRRGVVGDEEFERMDRIGLFHLLLFLPWRGGIVRQDDVAVVFRRGGVFHPQVAGGDLAVGQGGMFADGGLVAPGAADGENPGGRAVVALFFGDGSGGDGVDAFSPDESAFPEAALPGLADGFPAAAGFLIEAEGDLGAVPAIGGADEALGGARRELEGGGGENENKERG